MRAFWTTSALALAISGCVGTAGGDLFEFSAFAAGPTTADGSRYQFVSGRGYGVTLTRARLHVGAVYLNRAVATSVASDTSCTLAGIYGAEVTSGLDLNLLSPDLQRFPGLGSATADRALTGEVWLTGGDINDENDPTVILELAGEAERAGAAFPFEASLTIGSNRAVRPPSPAVPGANPICKQRVVSPIRVDVTPQPGGSLVLRVDPAGMFGNVDFSTLERSGDGIYRFADEPENQASSNLYDGMHHSAGVYSFSWR